MEGGSLFNSGFLGASFNWWIGQIAADSTWRDNIAPSKFETTDQIPGWGRRYKVRIIGLHDQGETEIKSEELPWAQVMYPVTAGGGQGSSGQTPNLRQGNMVFGFFLDGQEQQVPVIMGVLGNNAQTKLATKIGDGKVTNASPGSLAVSGFAVPSIGTQDPNIKVPDDDKATTPGQGVSKESADAVHQQSAADVKRLDLYTKKTVMLSPCDLPGSAMKAMQTEIENLTREIDKILQAAQEYIDAVSSNFDPLISLATQINDNIVQVNGIIGGITGELNSPIVSKCATNSPGAVPGVPEQIQALMERFALILAKYMKIIFTKIMEYISKKINEAIGPLADNLFPNQRFQFLDMKLEVNESIKCLFSKIIGGLSTQLLNALTDQVDVCNPSSGIRTDPTTGKPKINPVTGKLEYRGNSPLPQICSVEQLTGTLIAINEPEIKKTVESAIKSVETFVANIEAAQPKGFTIDPTSDLQIPAIKIPNLSIKLPNINLNLISALSFENITLDLFGCDLKPNCAASDFYSLQEGAGAAENPEQPRPAQVNQASVKAAAAASASPATNPKEPVPYTPPKKDIGDYKPGVTEAEARLSAAQERELIRTNNNPNLSLY